LPLSLGRSAEEVSGVADADKSDLVRPADDVYCWLEQDSSIMLKAVTRFGDPVELSADESRAIAVALIALADRLDQRAEQGSAEPNAAADKARKGGFG
jgi:hypothetical protein